MAKARIYLDYNATAPMREVAKQALIEAMDLVGNASSVHREGRKARAAIEKARDQLASLISADAKEIYLTSGGTETNNLVLHSDFGALGKKTEMAATLISAIEHPSLMKAQSLSKRPVELIKVDHNGLVDLEHLESLLKAWAEQSDLPVLVSVMLVNNETGVIQDQQKIGQLVHQYGGYLHMDAIQALGKVEIDFKNSQIDIMSLSGHKIGASYGVGALVTKLGILADPLIQGGGQELGMRAGTENIPAIASFGAAAMEAKDELANNDHLLSLRNDIEKEIEQISNGVTIFAKDCDRSPSTICFATDILPAERALMSLDLAGIAVSSGSACSSGKVSQSHVLKAMGIEEKLALGALRVSFSHQTKKEELLKFVSEYQKIYNRILEREQISA